MQEREPEANEIPFAGEKKRDNTPENNISINNENAKQSDIGINQSTDLPGLGLSSVLGILPLEPENIEKEPFIPRKKRKRKKRNNGLKR